MSVKWDFVDALDGLAEDLMVEGRFVKRIHEAVAELRKERDELKAEVERLQREAEFACENTPTKGCDCPGCCTARLAAVQVKP